LHKKTDERALSLSSDGAHTFKLAGRHILELLLQRLGELCCIPTVATEQYFVLRHRGTTEGIRTVSDAVENAVAFRTTRHEQSQKDLAQIPQIPKSAPQERNESLFHAEISRRTIVILKLFDCKSIF